MGEMAGAPGSWQWPGPATAAASIWGSKSAGGRSLYFSLFLSLSLCHWYLWVSLCHTKAWKTEVPAAPGTPDVTKEPPLCINRALTCLPKLPGTRYRPQATGASVRAAGVLWGTWSGGVGLSRWGVRNSSQQVAASELPPGIQQVQCSSPNTDNMCQGPRGLKWPSEEHRSWEWRWGELE